MRLNVMSITKTRFSFQLLRTMWGQSPLRYGSQ